MKKYHASNKLVHFSATVYIHCLKYLFLTLRTHITDHVSPFCACIILQITMLFMCSDQLPPTKAYYVMKLKSIS